MGFPLELRLHASRILLGLGNAGYSQGPVLPRKYGRNSCSTSPLGLRSWVPISSCLDGDFRKAAKPYASKSSVSMQCKMVSINS